jgi:hypothetical protein
MSVNRLSFLLIIGMMLLPGVVVRAELPSPAACGTVYAAYNETGINDTKLYGHTAHDDVWQTRPIGPAYSGIRFQSMAIHPLSRIVYALSDTSPASLYSIDALSGTLTLIGTSAASALAFDSNGTLWGKSADGLLRINPADAAAEYELLPHPATPVAELTEFSSSDGIVTVSGVVGSMF